MRQIILASTSPRRKQLLSLLAIKFKAVDPKYDEVLHQHLTHQDLVKFLAMGKAKAAAKKFSNAIIIAADTIVSFQGKALGKPKNAEEAIRTLKKLSGKAHYVYSGVAVIDTKTKKTVNVFNRVKISFRKLTKKEIENYVASKEPMDRAGSYAMQGLGFNLIKKIEGDITTVIGLPMTVVYNALKELGAII